MPAIIAWLLGALETRIGSIIISGLLTLGFSFTSYTFTVAPLRNYISQVAGGIPSMGLQVLGFLGVDAAITMLLSAVAAKYTINGVKSVLERRRPA